MPKSKLGKILSVVQEGRSKVRLRLNRNKKWEWQGVNIPPSVAGAEFVTSEDAIQAGKYADINFDKDDFESYNHNLT